MHKKCDWAKHSGKNKYLISIFGKCGLNFEYFNRLSCKMTFQCIFWGQMYLYFKIINHFDDSLLIKSLQKKHLDIVLFLWKMINPRIKLNFKWSKWFDLSIAMKYWTSLCLKYWINSKRILEKQFHIFFLQICSFMIFQSFPILAIKCKGIEVQKRAIPKKNHLNQIDLMYFMLKAHLRSRSRLKLAIYESHFWCITLYAKFDHKICMIMFWILHTLTFYMFNLTIFGQLKIW